ncbi:hypothetical protein ONE63_005668 [Megalurothrips usitatus]|uniref:pectin lyase n=1 Tax=Megalurothrips usitatus TaxID=439358 RepID=A0AAV7XZF9_9NEOP|nr:hypothetical protein ONE63_005668 [Megalurothrips usitatus]
MKRYLLLLFLLPAALAWNPNCINKPVGFGYRTTGGAGGRTVTPRNIDELRKYLYSKEKLIINLDRTYDYTYSEGTVKATGCFFQKCGRNNYQQSLSGRGTCHGRPHTTVTYHKAGLSELWISSHKTIMSSNGRGVIKGKGIRVKDAQNVIIRDITITDINPEVIWAGDAIGLDNVQNVWIHRVTTRRIGRQHLVTFQKTNKGITVSSCFFDGTSPHSAYCDNKHYWVWIFFGTHDEITLINNHVLNTAGRTPHTGGWSGAQNYVHMIYNTMDVNPHTGIEANQGARILSEGNLFIKYANPVAPFSRGGVLAMVNDNKLAQRCRGYFGQNCAVNKYSGSKVTYRWDETVLSQFSHLDKNAINSARNARCL